ncbi:hypothetical protein QUF50_00265 [Thiotrichales bacterium HSG1]|nr:hypothetical protein [Thiotrichales bacterium HSG1]
MNLLKISLSSLFISIAMIGTVLADTTAAIESLLNNAKVHYENERFEDAAFALERALRIEPKHPVLWHNLAGIRLAQKDWVRAANLANKSNTIAIKRRNSKELRIRNWVIITLACEGKEDHKCAREARKQAQSLVQSN